MNRRRAGRLGVREDRVVLDVGGRAVPLRVRRNARARKLTLRMDAAADGAVVTIPWATPIEAGLDLARRKADWLLGLLDKLPPRVPFADGAEIPILGAVHRIRHRAGARGVVWREAGEVHVAGRAEHLARRLTDWLRREARRELAARVADKAARVDRRPGRVTLRDTRSRWGSCSAKGNFSFCWRLVMAPEMVLDYVVAHEVAHLLEKNHGPRFWRLVDGLTESPGPARVWLRRHGESLHRHGEAPAPDSGARSG